jgi:YVTN family beta-propeller protein
LAFRAQKKIGKTQAARVRKKQPKTSRGIVTSLILAMAAGPAVAEQFNKLLTQPSSGPYVIRQQFHLGGTSIWDYLTIDSAAKRLFISRLDRVLVVNLSDGSLAATIGNTQGVHGIALASDLGEGFTSNGLSDTVTVFDLKSLRPKQTIAVEGRHPDAILYEHSSKRLYTFNRESRDISVIDPLRALVTARIPVGGDPEYAVTDDAGHVYFNIADTAQMGVISASSVKRTATWSLKNCENPTGLALDVVHERLFSTGENGVLVVTDAISGRHVAEVPIGKGSDAAAFDPERGIVFSSNGEDGTLTMIHEDDPDRYSVVANVATEKSARTMALDVATHRVYLVAAKYGPTPTFIANHSQPIPTVLEGTCKVLVLGD